MPKSYTLKEIKAFWQKQATLHGQSSASSWSDVPVMKMEVTQISRWLNDGDNVLDAGCANGSSTVQYAALKSVKIKGIDYVPEMIANAKLNKGNLDRGLQNAIKFEVGDVTDLHEPSESFDKVIVTRVIINLGNWRNQHRAIVECLRVVKPGGLLLLSEASIQGWRRLNKFRSEWGLDDIPMPPFNSYLDEERVISAVRNAADLVEIANFASTYYVCTRVFKALLATASGSKVKIADPDMEFNRWCAELPASGDYGTQKLFVFRKKRLTR